MILLNGTAIISKNKKWFGRVDPCSKVEAQLKIPKSIQLGLTLYCYFEKSLILSHNRMILLNGTATISNKKWFERVDSCSKVEAQRKIPNSIQQVLTLYCYFEISLILSHHGCHYKIARKPNPQKQ